MRERDGSRVLSSVFYSVSNTSLRRETVSKIKRASVACKHKRVEEKLESDKNASATTSENRG